MPFDKVEIKWLNTVSSLASQIYHSGLEYSLISQNLEQCHSFVYCKDFLQDATWGFLNKKRARIYGFQYDPTTRPPVCMELCRIALTNQSDPDFSSKIPKTLDFINQIAAEIHAKPTKIYEVSNPPKKYSKCGVFLLDGSQVWMNAPPLLSMYTLIIRSGFAHKIGENYQKTIENIKNNKVAQYQTNDTVQIKKAMKGISNIIKIGYRKFFYIDPKKNYPNETTIDTMHEACGIVNFASGCKLPVLYWQRKSLNKLLQTNI